MFKNLTIYLFTIVFSLSAYSKVEVYFNHYQYDSYKDPYRDKIRRGQDLEKVIVRNILSAKKSVFVAVQELRLPMIANALVQKYQEGLDVRIILEENYNNTILTLKLPKSDDVEDHESSRFHEFFAFVDINRSGKLSISELMQRDAIYILRKFDVPTKDDGINSEGAITGLMHHKFVVIDDEKVLLSSANFTMSGVHGDVLTRQSNGNSNALLEIGSKKLARLFTQEFMYMWGNESLGVNGRFKLNKPYRGREEVRFGGSKVTVQFSPTSKLMGRRGSVNGLIADNLATANRSIFMALFVFSDQRIADYVQARIDEIPNMEIGLLVEPRFAYRNYSEVLDFWGIELLDDLCEYEPDNNPFKRPVRNVGVPTLNSGDMLHHKFAVVDGNKVIFGSQNWSYAANHSNDEFLVVIEDEPVAQKFLEEFKRLNQNARIGIPRNLVEKIQQRRTDCHR